MRLVDNWMTKLAKPHMLFISTSSGKPMKLLTFILSCLIMIQTSASSHCESDPLNLKINEIKKLEGQLFVALHNSEQSYMKDETEPYRSAVVAVTNKGSQQISLCDVPEGKYVIAIYHDENSNNELDTGFLGIPKEPYGFSNNLKKMLPPSFEEATFHYAANSLIEVNLK